MTRRVVRRLAVSFFDRAYRLPERHPLYAVACGVESAWTVEGWRHDHDKRADRFGRSPWWAIVLHEAGKVARSATEHAPPAARGSEVDHG